MDLKLAGQVVVLTGGTSGIGLATAKEMVENRALVVTVSRGERPGVGEEFHVRADLSKPGESRRAVGEAIDRLGHVDVLVNNVGLAVARNLEDVTDEDWELSLRLNLMTAIWTTTATLPGMRDRGFGSIVNVASTAGQRPSKVFPDYGVAKAALLAYSRQVADANADSGIRCNAVIPGPTMTPAWTRTGGLAEQQGDLGQVLATAAAARPLGRFATSEEIANVIVFLASPLASHISGAEWSVSGGSVE